MPRHVPRGEHDRARRRRAGEAARAASPCWAASPAESVGGRAAGSLHARGPAFAPPPALVRGLLAFVRASQAEADAMRGQLAHRPALRGPWSRLNAQLVYAKALLRLYRRHYPDHLPCGDRARSCRCHPSDLPADAS